MAWRRNEMKAGRLTRAGKKGWEKEGFHRVARNSFVQGWSKGVRRAEWRRAAATRSFINETKRSVVTIMNIKRGVTSRRGRAVPRRKGAAARGEGWSGLIQSRSKGLPSFRFCGLRVSSGCRRSFPTRVTGYRCSGTERGSRPLLSGYDGVQTSQGSISTNGNKQGVRGT